MIIKVKDLTKKDILNLVEQGKVIPQSNSGSRAFKKTHYKESLNILKSFDDQDSLQHIINTLNSHELASKYWGSLDTIKAYARAINRLEIYLSENCLKENVETHKLLPTSPPPIEKDSNYPFETMKAKVKEIGKMYQFLLNSLEGGQISGKEDYIKSLTKLTLEELKQDMEKVISKL
jgi:hypothetical protein